jgi:hypothetical protein
MKLFRLNRVVDETGISGTGYVAEGVLFTNGRVVLQWLTETASTTIFNNIEDMEKIHGHGGLTQIEWVDWLDYGDD